MLSLETLAGKIRQLHKIIRAEVVASCESQSVSELAKVAREVEEDTIYAIDRISEERLIAFFEKEIPPESPIILIAEGIANGKLVLPKGAPEAKARYRIIMDPIDGTRAIMYQKRSAWILTGVAPNNGAATNLQDIEYAIQTEIPLLKQHLSDVVFAFRGKGINACRFNRLTEKEQRLYLTPSQAESIAHGFATVVRFFPGMREVLAAIDDEVALGAQGGVEQEKAFCFEDQYICTGGQLYELINGHDRFIADLRPLMKKLDQARSPGICCHPYDICTELIAREAGVIITDEKGMPLRPRLTVNDDVTWVGYANDAIQKQVASRLKAALRKRDLL